DQRQPAARGGDAKQLVELLGRRQLLQGGLAEQFGFRLLARRGLAHRPPPERPPAPGSPRAPGKDYFGPGGGLVMPPQTFSRSFSEISSFSRRAWVSGVACLFRSFGSFGSAIAKSSNCGEKGAPPFPDDAMRAGGRAEPAGHITRPSTCF